MTDPEWQNLMDDWREDAPTAAPAGLPKEERRRIRRKVRLRSYGLILMAAFEILGSLAVLVFLALELPERHRPVDLVGFAGMVVFLAAALAFTTWNRRGMWWPAAESTRTFVELSAERCRRRLRTLRFCPWLLGAEVAFLIPWSVWAFLSQAEPAPLGQWLAVFAWFALWVVALPAGLAWYRRRTLRELDEWEELLRNLDD